MAGRLDEARERQRVPGAQLGLLRRGERSVVCSGTTSVRPEQAEPIRPSTLFHAGSLAKSVAALVVVDAARRDELDLDVPCDQQGDGLWDDTPRSLLAQVTGRPNLLPEMGEDLRAFVARVGELPRVHPPGRFSYGNAGWSVLDLLLEQRCGAGFEALATTRVLGERAVFGAPGAGAAEGHAVDGDGDAHPVPPDYAEAASAAGSRWWATADDLLDLAQLHLDRGAGRFHEDDVLALQRPEAPIPGATVADAWGLGWALWERGDHRAFGWAGFTGGHRAYLRCFPAQEAALAVLTNGAGSLFHAPGGTALFDDLLGPALDKLGVPPLPPPPPPPVPPTGTAAPAETLAGRYGPIEVRAVEGVPDELVVDAAAFGEPAPFRYVRADGSRFVVPGEPSGSLPIALEGDLLYLGPMAMARLEADSGA